MVRYLYHNRLAVDIAGLKMKTPVTTASGTFGFGLEFTFRHAELRGAGEPGQRVLFERNAA